MKLKLIFIGLVTLLEACSEAQTPAELCKQTVMDYASFRDNPDKAKEYGALFTVDGTFTLGPNTVKGRDAIIARHKTANAAMGWNHLMDEINISEDGLSGQSGVVVYTSPLGEPDNITRFIVAAYTDQFKIKDGACKIANRKVSIKYDSNSARVIPAGD